MLEFIEIKASLAKAQVTPVHQLELFANAAPLIVDGKTYDTREICFFGFAGGPRPDEPIFDGVLRFLPNDNPDRPTADLSVLPGVSVPAAPEVEPPQPEADPPHAPLSAEAQPATNPEA